MEERSQERRHYRICPLCEACCGLEVRTQGDRIVGIRGAESDVFSRGYVCPKGAALKDLHEDPDRLRTPLIRRDGRFVPASWDEAIAEIERRLAPIQQAHGRDAVAPFTPERVATRYGIAAADIRTLARELATAERGCVYGRLGTCGQRFGSVASWLVDVLNALTGHLDEPGGAMWPLAAAFAHNSLGKPGIGRGVTTGRHHSRVSGAPEVFGELPLTLLAEEIETPGPGQVRALFTIAGNPVQSAPGGPRLVRALDTLDLMVSVDIHLNETTRHAHVILPGRSPLEDSHYDVAFPQLSDRNHARWSGPVFEPAPGHLPEWQLLLKLAAIAQGLGATADPLALDDDAVAQQVRTLAGPQADAVLKALGTQKGPDRLLDLALRSGPYRDQFGLKPEGLNLAKVQAAAGGIDLGQLRPRVPEVLRTPSGRIELAPPLLLADLAQALATVDEPAPALVVIGRRDVRSNNSWMHNLPTLAKGPQRCTAIVHPQDAACAGVQDGQQVRLVNDQATLTVPVTVSDEVMPGVVSLPHG